MAAIAEVKRYIAQWLQLGKTVVLGHEPTNKLNKIIVGEKYSSEFESLWQEIMAIEGKNCHLSGTDVTIDQLLTPSWEISPCARCNMPIPMKLAGINCQACPCLDIPTWPNQELPSPRLPISNFTHLSRILNKLKAKT